MSEMQVSKLDYSLQQKCRIVNCFKTKKQQKKCPGILQWYEIGYSYKGHKYAANRDLGGKDM